MRTFISIEMSEEVKDYLYDLENKFKKELKKHNIKISWVHRRNLHLTLKFLGEINDKKLEDIKDKLMKIKFKPFELSINKIGFFPSDDYIKTIFVSLNPESKVMELQKQIDQELLDINTKDQEFHAHVTLGRVKSFKDREKLKKVVYADLSKIKFKVDNFNLMKSELSKDGPKYFLLEKF